MKKLDFVYFDAGGGHRAAATALKLVIEQQNRPWQVRLVHLRDILDSIDVFRKVTRIDLQEIYNLILRKGWTLGSAQGLRFMQGVIRMLHPASVRLLADFWRRDTPDMVVSLVPNFNRALFDACRRVNPALPYVTVLTDLADYPPHFWMESQNQYVVCGTAKAERQALERYPRGQVFRTSGMILHPRFYERPEIDRASQRRALGLDAGTPTGLVLFGGYGSAEMGRILRRLDLSSLNLQLILICGRNQALQSTLSARATRVRKHVAGFTTDVPAYMRLADFFIGKPGPGSVSEAVHMGLPVITVRNILTLPQERYNAAWLEENKLGIVVRSFRDVVPAAGQLLAGTTLRQFREHTAALQNRAVFEIPGILEGILSGASNPGGEGGIAGA